MIEEKNPWANPLCKLSNLSGCAGDLMVFKVKQKQFTYCRMHAADFRSVAFSTYDPEFEKFNRRYRINEHKKSFLLNYGLPGFYFAFILFTIYLMHCAK